ncbi:monocarboxylate transporter 12-like [Ptychodera flava]|uniref:monocarboxylate transporter 12-like n=1 Tax=Ptychodera flava TaxID=63121 RepID=UPI00396A5A1E
MEEVKHREQPENVSEFRKWLVVLGCNVVLIFVLGLNQAIGPFFVELMRHFDEGAGQTSLIVTLSVFFTTCTGPVANLMTKRFGCRVTVITGGVLSTVGHLLSSFANSVPFLCLSYGVLVGLGFGLAYSPSVGMVSKYFKKGHALANGLAYTGSGLGIFIFPPFLQLLIDTYGWKGSFLAFSSVNANICVCGALFTEPGKLLTERESSDDARTGVEDTDQPVEEENHSDKTACRSDDAQARRNLWNFPTSKEARS